MEHNDNDPTFPFAAWQIQSIPAYDSIIVCLDFLSHATQAPDDPNPGRRYILSSRQAQDLADGILRQVQNLNTAGFQPGPDQQH